MTVQPTVALDGAKHTNAFPELKRRSIRKDIRGMQTQD